MKFAGVVFDKDGTLLDFNSTWLPIYQEAADEFAGNDPQLRDRLLADHGFDLDTQRCASGSLLAAGNNREIAEAWSVNLSMKDKVDEISRRLEQIFKEQGSICATPVKQLKATLEQLKSSGLKLGVATADSHAGILNTLSAFEVLHQFEFLAGYDSGHGIKPSGDMVLAFCSKMQLAPHQVIVVGDNKHDIEMGRNANAGLCVGVLTGTSIRADLEPIADIVLEDISQLPDII
ncbi:MAG: HAD family hydrolase [Pseudomonadota bacterium]